MSAGDAYRIIDDGHGRSGGRGRPSPPSSPASPGFLNPGCYTFL